MAVRAKAVDNLMRHGFLGGQHLKTLAVFRLFTVRALPYIYLYTASLTVLYGTALSILIYTVTQEPISKPPRRR